MPFLFPGKAFLPSPLKIFCPFVLLKDNPHYAQWKNVVLTQREIANTTIQASNSR
jgi:hypothetical protein